MSVDKLINLGVTLTLIEMMVTIGLGVTLAQVARVAQNVTWSRRPQSPITSWRPLLRLR